MNYKYSWYTKTPDHCNHASRKMNFLLQSKLQRKLTVKQWNATDLYTLIIVYTVILLMLKKEWDWIRLIKKQRFDSARPSTLEQEWYAIRISHRSCSETKGVLTNSTNFAGKQLCLRPVTLLKKRLWDSCFPVNFAKFLRTPFLQNTSGRLLLCHVPVDGMDILGNNAQAHSQSF